MNNDDKKKNSIKWKSIAELTKMFEKGLQHHNEFDDYGTCIRAVLSIDELWSNREKFVVQAIKLLSKRENNKRETWNALLHIMRWWLDCHRDDLFIPDDELKREIMVERSQQWLVEFEHAWKLNDKAMIVKEEKEEQIRLAEQLKQEQKRFEKRLETNSLTWKDRRYFATIMDMFPHHDYICRDMDATIEMIVSQGGWRDRTEILEILLKVREETDPDGDDLVCLLRRLNTEFGDKKYGTDRYRSLLNEVKPMIKRMKNRRKVREQEEKSELKAMAKMKKENEVKLSSSKPPSDDDIWNQFGRDIDEMLCPSCQEKTLYRDRSELGFWHRAHILPKSEGWPYALWNLIPICGSCNGKSSKHQLIRIFHKYPTHFEEIVIQMAKIHRNRWSNKNDKNLYQIFVRLWGNHPDAVRHDDLLRLCLESKSSPPPLPPLSKRKKTEEDLCDNDELRPSKKSKP
jgi:hypothetical protein